MSAPVLSFRTESGELLKVDIPTLLETRLLAQGSSGSGKTTLLFDIVQQLYGSIQILILDKEGQFAKLREKYDFLLVGPDGELPLDMRKGAPELLLRKVLEQQVNVIWDLSEMSPLEQKNYAARLVREAAHLPVRSGLWEQMRVFVIDEIQHFAPQGGKISDQPALEPMVEFLSLSRKRGFCPIAATVRVEKVSKDVTDMLENRMVGRSGDKSSKTAADLLDFDRHGQRELKQLQTFSFYAYGPALSLDPTLVNCRSEKLPVRPRRRGELIAPPATPKNVKKVLAAFEGFQAEAEEHAHSLEELRATVVNQKKRIRDLEKGAPKTPVAAPVVDAKAIARAVADAQRDSKDVQAQLATSIKKLRAALESAMKFIINITAQDFDAAGVDKAELEKAINAAVVRASQLVDQRLGARAKQLESLKQSALDITNKLRAALGDEEVVIDLTVRKTEPFAVAAQSTPQRVNKSVNDGEPRAEGVTRPQQRILNALASLKAVGLTDVDKSNVAVFADQSPMSSGFSNNLGSLRTAGLIDYPQPGRVGLTDAGAAIAEAGERISTVQQLHQAWFSKLPNPLVRILQVLIERGELGREALADHAGQSPTSSGYANNLGRLRGLGLIDYPKKGHVAATDLLFPEELT